MCRACSLLKPRHKKMNLLSLTYTMPIVNKQICYCSQFIVSKHAVHHSCLTCWDIGISDKEFLQCVESAEQWECDISDLDFLKIGEQTDIDILWDETVSDKELVTFVSKVNCMDMNFWTKSTWDCGISDQEFLHALAKVECSMNMDNEMNDSQLVQTVTDIEGAVFDLGFDLSNSEDPAFNNFCTTLPDM